MDGPVCLLIDPLYVIDVEGKDMHFEWNERCGPTVVEPDGTLVKGWPLPEEHPFWKSLGRWISCGRRVDKEGRCLLEPDAKVFVAGFLFSIDLRWVVLIEKKRPVWQEGKWNAVGGRLEAGESPAQAMRREFREETSLDHEGWTQFLTLDTGNGNIVHFFHGTSDGRVQDTTDERVAKFLVSNVNEWRAEHPLLYNLPWLVNMALECRMLGHSYRVVEMFRT